MHIFQVKKQAPQVVLASRMLFENPDSEVSYSYVCIIHCTTKLCDNNGAVK